MFANSRVQAQRPGDPVLLHGSVAVWPAALGGQVAGPAVRQRRQDPVCETEHRAWVLQSATRCRLYNLQYVLLFTSLFCVVQFTQIDVY